MVAFKKIIHELKEIRSESTTTTSEAGAIPCNDSIHTQSNEETEDQLKNINNSLHREDNSVLSSSNASKQDCDSTKEDNCVNTCSQELELRTDDTRTVETCVDSN